jgi:hypothetical protein
MLAANHGAVVMASIGLASFIDESLRRSAQRGYHPTDFIRMRAQYKTVPAIERLVKSGEIQSGFKKLKQLDLLEWSIEAAVQNFPDEFTPEARACANFRLGPLDDDTLNARRS